MSYALIGLATSDLDSRVGGRALRDLTHKARQDLGDFVVRGLRLIREQRDFSFQVEAVARLSEQELAAVSLGQPMGEVDKSRRRSDRHDQDSGRQRIERPGVSHLCAPTDEPDHPIDDRARCDPRRFVNVEQAKHCQKICPLCATAPTGEDSIVSDSELAPDDDRDSAEVDYASLVEALRDHAIELPAEQIEAIDAYRQLLWQLNENINLTRHTTFAKFVERDVVDTLQLAEHVERGARVLDIGSGGGVPGLLLAIVRPDLDVSVCDSVGKKSRVLGQMVSELELPVRVFAARVQDVLELTTFDTLVARGVASIRKLLTWLDPHWDAFDEVILIKGRKWIEERGEARHHGLMHGKQLRKLATYETRNSGESVVLRIWSEEAV